MKQIVFICILICTGLISFSQDNLNRTDEQGKKHGIWKKYLDNGKLIYEGTFMNDKPVGLFRRYHSSGALKAILKYDVYSDSTDAQLFDTRSKLIAKGKYSGKIKIGNWQYYKSGLLISKEHFVNGKKDGLSKTYYPDGRLFEEVEWKFGLKNGIYRAYFKSGKPYMECKMVNNLRDGFCLIYYPNNELELEAFYNKNLRHNQWKYFSKSGELSHVLEYDMGILLNPEVSDSIQNINMKQMELNKGKLLDPEKFMQDPSEYMMKNNMFGR